MKIVSPVYVNSAIRFGDSLIEFENGAAEVSKELFEEIKSSGFPNIYAEGTAPGLKTKASIDFDKTIKELNTEYMEEIDRLKKTNAARAQENKELKQQLENLKVTYDKDIKALQAKLVLKASEPDPIAKTPVETVEHNTNAKETSTESDEEKEIRKDLESMKLLELQKIATSQGLDPEGLKALTKKELIDVIMGKTE